MRICRKGEDMKRYIVLIMALVLVGCTSANGGEKGHFTTADKSSGELAWPYYDEEMTNEREELEEQTERAVSVFLNRDKDELEFRMFCLLARDGTTIEVMVDGVSYTFTCSMQGDVISVRRTDGELFDLKEK